jgi:hypothetical protein
MMVWLEGLGLKSIRLGIILMGKWIGGIVHLVRWVYKSMCDNS